MTERIHFFAGYILRYSGLGQIINRLIVPEDESKNYLRVVNYHSVSQDSIGRFRTQLNRLLKKSNILSLIHFDQSFARLVDA